MKMRFLLPIIFLLSSLISTESILPPYACESSNPSTKLYLFCNASLPINQRVQDLVSRLTLDEKVTQLINSASSIPRLGIPQYEWWSEALHGVAEIKSVSQGIHFNGTIKSATSFPQVILTAASFDARLWYRIGKAIGVEARGIYNAGQALGMTFWAPNINIYRDPRWGRGQETPGEDPLVVGRYAVSYVRGIQGDSIRGGKLGEHLQASACCKHFTAYDLDNWNGVNRFVFNANVTLQDMADTYQPPFKSCIQEGQASGIMCAYNRVNGIPNCADYSLLTETARGKWDFKGYITSDCDAVSIIHDEQGYAKSPEDAVADVLKAGMDVNCGSYLRNYTKSAVNKKKVAEYEVDRALHNLFAIRMRLGLFNGNPTSQPYGNIAPKDVCSKEHQDLALEAARNGIVLLKNSAKLLPLSKKTMSLAVIGPNANSAHTLQGNYEGPPCKSVTPLQALKRYVNKIKYHTGCNNVACSVASLKEAVRIAENVDQVVMVMGLDQTQEREDYDRVNLNLPGKQKDLITSVAKAAKKPIVLVLLCGGPVDISFTKIDQKIGSILWAGYPGEAGGIALAEILFGDHNPGGVLPMTWYPSDFIKVPMTDMRMRADLSLGYPGRTYRFYKGPKVFEFGFGLSYSNYSYQLSSIPKKIDLKHISSLNVDKKLGRKTGYTLVSQLDGDECETMRFSVTLRVQNQGEMAGKHPILLFAEQIVAENGSRPMKHLVGFETVNLKAGEKTDVGFQLNPCEHFSVANEKGMLVIEEGVVMLSVAEEKFPISIVV